MRLILPLLVCAAINTTEASSWRQLEVEVTAYCPCDVCTNGKGVTANGTKTLESPYNIALSRAAEKRIPLGSVVWIPSGEGYLDVLRADDRMFIADDRTHKDAGPTLSDRPLIDLRYRTHYSATQFGRKLITIFVWQD